MIRNIDELGRVVIPMEFRKEMNIQPYTPVRLEMISFNEIKITIGSTLNKEDIQKEIDRLEALKNTL